MGFSLYIHIPYCQAKCPYCDFNSYAASAWPEADYTRALIAEIERRSSEVTFAGESLRTIFFGGGTPSLFAPESIGAILDAASRRFGIESDAEITLEANPGTVDEPKLAGMRAAGINRISFGAQSFNNQTLKFLGRIHDAAQTREAATLAHRAGFDRLNLDLIFAVPGQTAEDVIRDIGEAAALGPDHISAYNLTFEEGTAFFTDMKRGRIKPLANDEQAAMYAAVREELPRRGYGMYEISNYARPGSEARHNLTYWRADTYLGIGAGAHSFGLAPANERARGGRYGRRWWNERNPARYIEMARAAGLAESGAEEIDAATGASEFVFLNLRLRDGFALADFRARLGRDFDEVFGARALPLIEGGLLIRDRGRIFLSYRGLELADSVFAEFV
ncbi:MAG: radical SAM family heme chaperone HemW [Candidatus Binataceae bacterium]